MRQFPFITKCDGLLLQSVTILLQSATGITKCDDYYKVRQYRVILSDCNTRSFQITFSKRVFFGSPSGVEGVGMQSEVNCFTVKDQTQYPTNSVCCL